MAKQKINSAQFAPSKTTDANGWTVYDYGTWKEYIKNLPLSFTVNAVSAANSPNTAMPVGVTMSSTTTVSHSSRFDGYDGNRLTSCIQTRSLPTSLFIEYFNTWTGGNLPLTGVATIRIVV